MVIRSRANCFLKSPDSTSTLTLMKPKEPRAPCSCDHTLVICGRWTDCSTHKKLRDWRTSLAVVCLKTFRGFCLKERTRKLPAGHGRYCQCLNCFSVSDMLKSM